jgi:hypothetical protein
MPVGDNRTSRANRALDAANFFLADVRDALGPYLAVYLLTEQKWDEARIGIVMSVATITGILAQTPAGALVDTNQPDVGLHRRRAGGDGASGHAGRRPRRPMGPQAVLPGCTRDPASSWALYTLSDNAAWLVGVQLLDGTGAGIFGRRRCPRHQSFDFGPPW